MSLHAIWDAFSPIYVVNCPSRKGTFIIAKTRETPSSCKSQELHAFMASVGKPAQARLSQLTRSRHWSLGACSHGQFHEAAIAFATHRCTAEALSLCTVKRCAVSGAATTAATIAAGSSGLDPSAAPLARIKDRAGTGKNSGTALLRGAVHPQSAAGAALDVVPNRIYCSYGQRGWTHR